MSHGFNSQTELVTNRVSHMSNMTVRPINEELENEETDLFDPLSRVVEMGLEMGSEVGLGNIFYNGILIQ